MRWSEGDLFIYKSALNDPNPDILMIAEVAHPAERWVGHTYSQVSQYL